MKVEKLWIEKMVDKIQHEVEKLKSKELFESFICYLGESALRIDNMDTIITLTQGFGLSKLSEAARLNLLMVIYKYEMNREKSQNDQKFWSFRELVCRNLLLSELFYHYENPVVYNGKLYKLKYYGSFALREDLIGNSFKILPKNRTSSNQISETYENSEADAQSNIPEDNLFEASKALEEENLQREYKKMATKYFLYKHYHSLAELPVNNEQIDVEFFELQNKNFNLIKFKENYANFLIDITLILHEIGLPYKTNMECEQTKLLIDIGIVDQKTAILYVDGSDAVCHLKNEQKTYHHNTFMELKGKLLEKAGWNVIYVIYDYWNVDNDTKDKKEYDLRKKLDKLKAASL